MRMRWGLGIAGGTLGAVAALVIAAGAFAKPDDPQPQPKPKLEMVTASQQQALDERAITVAVSSKRGKKVRADATLVVEGFPADYTFKLGPESKPLKRRQAKLRFPLSARKREVLEFAAQACDKATVEVEARAARKTGRLEATLRSEGC
jgi:hypothetical protein